MLTDVQQWLDSPATNFGWIMLGNESTGQTAKRFGGQDARSPESPPELTVEYDPPWIWSGSAGDGAERRPATGPTAAVFPAAARRSCWASSHQRHGGPPFGGPQRQPPDLRRNQAMTITSTAPGGGRLTLDNGSGPVAVIVSGSGQAIDGHVAVTLDSDAWITTGGSSDSLSIAASIGNGTAAHGIVKDGLGTLILSGDNTYGGGTTVNDGTLEICGAEALPSGTSLTAGADAASLFGSTMSDGAPLIDSPATAVPEPGLLVLLAVGALAAGLRVRRRDTTRIG